MRDIITEKEDGFNRLNELIDNQQGELENIVSEMCELTGEP